MLTRLKVNGFKNLVDVDIRFGPFTCVAGANGVGKSNLFDAILFLSALADRPLIEAALSVRDASGRTADVRNLFHRVGDRTANTMSFEVEMIVPREGVDDLGQRAKASITFLRYRIKLAYQAERSPQTRGGLELIEEELTRLRLGDAYEHLRFPHRPVWRDSVLHGRRNESPFISTAGMGPDRVIKQHQDGTAGRPLSRLAVNLPRTVLSVANAAESPTMFLARNEMRSWRLLQLEPASLRRPDEFTAPTRLGMDGAHLAATLYHLAWSSRLPQTNGVTADEHAAQVYARVANRLAELLGDVRAVSIDRDDKRELLTLLVTSHDGTSLPARALSDGTLRFLALAVLDQESEAQGLLCLEEPENGIHPARILAMLHLLQDIATDPRGPVDPDNPLRQVIFNTHSPSVVKQVPDDSLVIAKLRDTVAPYGRFKRAHFQGLSGTWQQEASGEAGVPLGVLLDYLNPEEPEPPTPGFGESPDYEQARRVMDRPDVQSLLPLFAAHE